MQLLNCTNPDCLLQFKATEECFGKQYFCPYCGKGQNKSTEDYLGIKEAMENDLKNNYKKDRQSDFYFYWGMIEFASNRGYITSAEASDLKRLNNK